MTNTQEPKATLGMSIGGLNSLNGKHLPTNEKSEREWSYGFWSCFGDCSTCLCAWCCPCVLYGQVSNRLEHLSEHGSAHPENGGSWFNAGCGIYLLTSCLGLSFVPSFLEREKIRNRYTIEGSTLGDCCAAFWCGTCELTQAAREVELEEQMLGGRRI